MNTSRAEKGPSTRLDLDKVGEAVEARATRYAKRSARRDALFAAIETRMRAGAWNRAAAAELAASMGYTRRGVVNVACEVSHLIRREARLPDRASTMAERRDETHRVLVRAAEAGLAAFHKHVAEGNVGGAHYLRVAVEALTAAAQIAGARMPSARTVANLAGAMLVERVDGMCAACRERIGGQGGEELAAMRQRIGGTR